jgi:putative hemolysin
MITYALVRVLAVLLLVAANAFFVAAEFALVSVRDTRIQQLIEAGRLRARTVQKLHQRMDELLGAVQLGVTLASLGLGWVGEPTLAALFQSPFSHIPHAAIYAHALAVVVAFILITYLHVVLGELVPKSVALQRVERVALAVAGPLDVFMTVARPFLRVLSGSARVVLKVFSVSQAHAGAVHSAEELKKVVTASRRYGMVDSFAEGVMVHALELGEITVRQVMTPRHSIFSLPADMNLDQAQARVVEEQHSRVPVYDPARGPEHIIGLLYSKDVTRWMRRRYTAPPDDPAGPRLGRMQVRDIMRDVLLVPETKPLPDLLAEFKRRKRHLAVVVDEFGSTSGVITVEDVLEQIVGEIEDEFDISPQPLPVDAARMVLDGSMNIRDLETQYKLPLPTDAGFETLAGFVLAHLQRIPRSGDTFQYEGRRFTVLEMQDRRVARVLVEQAAPQPAKPMAG